MTLKAALYHTRFKKIYDMNIANEIYIQGNFLMVNYVQFNNDFKILTYFMLVVFCISTIAFL